MKIKNVYLILLLLSINVSASQPVWMDWNEVSVASGNVKVEAKATEYNRDLVFLKIITEWGAFELSEAQMDAIPHPRLNSINLVMFPLDVSFDKHEYHLKRLNACPLFSWSVFSCALQSIQMVKQT